MKMDDKKKPKKKATPASKKMYADKKRVTAVSKVKAPKSPGARGMGEQKVARAGLRTADNMQIKANRAAKEAENSSFNNSQYNTVKGKQPI